MSKNQLQKRQGAPKKALTLAARISFRASQELVDWLEAEGIVRGLGIGDMARMLLMETRNNAKTKGE